MESCVIVLCGNDSPQVVRSLLVLVLVLVVQDVEVEGCEDLAYFEDVIVGWLSNNWSELQLGAVEGEGDFFWRPDDSLVRRASLVCYGRFDEMGGFMRRAVFFPTGFCNGRYGRQRLVRQAALATGDFGETVGLRRAAFSFW